MIPLLIEVEMYIKLKLVKAFWKIVSKYLCMHLCTYNVGYICAYVCTDTLSINILFTWIQQFFLWDYSICSHHDHFIVKTNTKK